MEDKDLNDLEADIRAIEAMCNAKFGEIVDDHGLNGILTALVNLGTTFVAKALVMTPAEGRDSVLLTVQMLINSRTSEGVAAVESSLAITRAMGSTCRPH